MTYGVVRAFQVIVNTPEKAGVGGSTPSLATIIPKNLVRAGDYSRSALSPHSRDIQERRTADE